MDRYYQVRATIDVTTSTTVSGGVDILGYRVVGFATPAAWDAANVRFQVDPGDGTYRLVVDKTGNAFEVAATVSQCILLSAHAAVTNQPGGTPHVVGANIKVVATAAQSADREIVLLCEKI